MTFSGTTRNEVKGRQPNDRREAGVPVTGDPLAGVTGAEQRFGGSYQLPPSVYRFLAESQQPISATSINHSLVIGRALWSASVWTSLSGSMERIRCWLLSPRDSTCGVDPMVHAGVFGVDFGRGLVHAFVSAEPGRYLQMCLLVPVRVPSA